MARIGLEPGGRHEQLRPPFPTIPECHTSYYKFSRHHLLWQSVLPRAARTRNHRFMVGDRSGAP